MSPTTASGHSLVDQEVMGQFTQMRSMLSLFLGQKQETTTHTAFCNYQASEVEGLEEKDFQTFRHEAVKLFSNIQSKAEESGHHLQQPQQQMLSHSSSATSTFVPQTFPQPQQPAPAATEYVLTIPETRVPSSQVIQPTQQGQVASKRQQQSSGQPTSFLVVHNQQAGPSRPLKFTKHVNPASVASATGEDSQHQDFQAFGNLQSVMS